MSVSFCKAVGVGGRIVSFNGTTWSADTSGIANAINGVAYVSTNFCKFDGAEAAGVTVQNANPINATTPAHAPGTVAVTVHNPNGTGGTIANGFAYVTGPLPAISSVTPTSGPAAGGTPVTINRGQLPTGRHHHLRR